jgi:Ca2+-binding EF-hand superfamily protein
MFRRNRVRFIVAITVVVAAATFLGTAAAQKASVPRPQDRLAMGEEHVKQLLLIMETDSNGMISRQEYMEFMEAEFQRLDKNKQGRLDARQLNQSMLSAGRFAGK